ARLLTRARRAPVQLGHAIFPSHDQAHALLFGEGGEKYVEAVETGADGKKVIHAHIFLTTSYRVHGDETPRVTQYVYSLLNLNIPTALAGGQVIELNLTPFLAPTIE